MCIFYLSIHTHSEILFSHKKKEILLFATWLDFKGIMLSETSDKANTVIISFTCGNLKKQKQAKTKPTQIDTANRLVVARGRGWGLMGEMDELHFCFVGFFFVFLFFFFFCLFAISWATPAAYGGSQARGPIGAVAIGLCQSHSNAGSELHLQPTPQLTATPDP